MKEGCLERSRAYNYAEPVIAAALEEHPSIQVVIDLHRDGVNGSKRLVTEINGKPTAQIMFFNGPSAQPTTPDENTPTPTPAEPGANTATDVTWSCSQTLSAPDQYQGGIAKIELIQDDGNGNETSITIMDGQAITSWPYSVNTNWSASSSASSTRRIVFYEMDSSGSYQAIAQYPSVPLSEG